MSVHRLAQLATYAGWGTFIAVWVVGALHAIVHHGRVSGFSWGKAVAERLIVVGVVAATYALGPSVWSALRVTQPVVELAGAGLLLAGAGLAVWARFTLGVMWASEPLVRDEHRLVTSGAYRLVRHPIYTGLVTMLAATALAGGTPRFIAYTLAAMLVVRLRIPAEEALMNAAFGEQWERYRAATPALIPRLRRLP